MEKYITINQNKLSIRTKLYCTDLSRIESVIIFGHGFSGHKDNRAAEKLAKRLQKRHGDVAVLVYDLPCHGDDASNKLTVAGCMTYLDNVLAYVRTRFKTDRLYACATSFGGYLVLRYISEHENPFLKIALRCPAVNMYEIVTERITSPDLLETLRKGKPISVGFDRKVKITGDFLTELKENDITRLDFSAFADDIMIVHGTSDEIVPFDTVRDFAQKNGLAFYPIEGADHRFTDPQKMDKAIAMQIAALCGSA